MNILFLFFTIVVIVALFPDSLKNLYDNIFGRIIMLFFILFVAKKNLLLAIILLVLCLFIMQSFSNPFPYLENFDTNENKIVESQGVDLETIKNSVQSVPSNTIPVSKTNGEIEPQPHEEGMTSKKK